MNAANHKPSSLLQHTNCSGIFGRSKNELWRSIVPRANVRHIGFTLDQDFGAVNCQKAVFCYAVPNRGWSKSIQEIFVQQRPKDGRKVKNGQKYVTYLPKSQSFRTPVL